MRKQLFSIGLVLISFLFQGYSKDIPKITDLEDQPLLAHAQRLNEALNFLGSSLTSIDSQRLKELKNEVPSAKTSQLIQEILDPYCLAMITINPEARVKVMRGSSKPQLVQNGWKSFLV